MSLSHKHPECTGRWSLRSVNGTSYWKRSQCGAIGYATDVNRSVAVEENLAGRLCHKRAPGADWEVASTAW